MKGLKLRNPIKFSRGSGQHSNASPIKNFFAKRESKTDSVLKKKGNSKFSSSSISPSTGEFNKMMSSFSGKTSSKKSMFRKRM